MRRPISPTSVLLAVLAMAVALAASGCTNPLSSTPSPSAIVAIPYLPPSPTPMPILSPTPLPAPATSWNGMYARLYGNVTANGGDHVYGTIKIHYLDKNYYDESPTVSYDTADKGGSYSINVRENVSFRPEFGYYYVGRLPQVMYTKLLDTMVVQNDTRLDYSVMTSNITPVT